MYKQAPPGAGDGEIKSVTIPKGLPYLDAYSAATLRDLERTTRFRDWAEEKLGQLIP